MSSEHDTDTSRVKLIWNMLVFQAKLSIDGVRDLLLMPVALAATLLGLIFGGSEPDRYFRQVLEWGRRTEDWLNLFGHRNADDTADSLMEPFQQRVFEEFERNPSLRRANASMNRAFSRPADAPAPPSSKETTPQVSSED